MNLLWLSTRIQRDTRHGRREHGRHGIWKDAVEVLGGRAHDHDQFALRAVDAVFGSRLEQQLLARVESEPMAMEPQFASPRLKEPVRVVPPLREQPAIPARVRGIGGGVPNPGSNLERYLR